MTQHKSRLRKALFEDAEALTSCIEAAYAKYVGRISNLPAVSEGIAEEISTNQVWVAVEGANIVGGLFLVPKSGFLKLSNLAVHPNHSGKGLGRTMMAHAEREAKRQGFTELQLNTHIKMPDNIALYTHLGWQELSRTDHTVTMRKQL